MKKLFKGNMGNNNDDNEPKKGLSGGFFLFVIAAILIILTVQNLSSEKSAKVSFSHQVEHLTNLDLLQKDESKKIALNDNLVTFTGKFRDRLTEEAQARYRYLELLNRQYELQEARQRLSSELDLLGQNAIDSATRFLQISGTALPSTGFQIVSSQFDTQDRVNALVISSLPKYSGVNLATLRAHFTHFTPNSSVQEIREFGADLISLVQSYRSASVGIGVESIKDRLAAISNEVSTIAVTATSRELLAVYGSVLQEMKEITDSILEQKNGVTLLALRSVRSYLVDVDQFGYVSKELSDNTQRLDKARTFVADTTWYYNNKLISTRALEKQDPEDFSRWYAQAKIEWDNFAFNKGLPFKAPDQPRNAALEQTFKSKEPAPNYLSYFFTFLPVLMIVFLLYFVFSRQMKGMGNNAMNFGKSPAKLLNKSTLKVTFKDVAGVDEAKEELQEIVDFLKYPGKFTALGARIPKGALLIGPPGTGKTLIAKAVAGEADRPFFSISGSDFVEMFVGVGASRIRDLFDQAKKNAPCIVFIDEIDAVGRHRGAGIGGGHDEREQTLNQLLVEMDGFDTNEGVILVAATNRPDVLDKALLRPGRFDRRITLDLPDMKGRLEILKVHARRVKLDSSVDLQLIARTTPGCSGAELMNILNEAALIAARKGRSAVTMPDAFEAVEKVRYGKERRSLELDQTEKKHTAYHESGHAIVGLCVEKADPVEKVTIIPRGMSLGATYYIPEKNKVSHWKKELHDRLAVLMGGRIAEQLFLGDLSSGAQMDIAQATRLARAMVTEWGMTDLGPVNYGDRIDDPVAMYNGGAEKSYSQETAKRIDEEIEKILQAANVKATEILESRREQVELMTAMLLEFETLDREDVHAIVNGTWDIEKKREKVKFAATANIQPGKQTEEVRPSPIDIRPQQA